MGSSGNQSMSQGSTVTNESNKDTNNKKQQSMMKFTTKEKSPPSASDIYGFQHLFQQNLVA